MPTATKFKGKTLVCPKCNKRKKMSSIDYHGICYKCSDKEIQEQIIVNNKKLTDKEVERICNKIIPSEPKKSPYVPTVTMAKPKEPIAVCGEAYIGDRYLILSNELSVSSYHRRQAQIKAKFNRYILFCFISLFIPILGSLGVMYGPDPHYPLFFIPVIFGILFVIFSFSITYSRYGHILKIKWLRFRIRCRFERIRQTDVYRETIGLII